MSLAEKGVVRQENVGGAVYLTEIPILEGAELLKTYRLRLTELVDAKYGLSRLGVQLISKVDDDWNKKDPNSLKVKSGDGEFPYVYVQTPANGGIESVVMVAADSIEVPFTERLSKKNLRVVSMKVVTGAPIVMQSIKVKPEIVGLGWDAVFDCGEQAFESDPHGKVPVTEIYVNGLYKHLNPGLPGVQFIGNYTGLFG